MELRPLRPTVVRVYVCKRLYPTSSSYSSKFYYHYWRPVLRKRREEYRQDARTETNDTKNENKYERAEGNLLMAVYARRQTVWSNNMHNHIDEHDKSQAGRVTSMKTSRTQSMEYILMTNTIGARWHLRIPWTTNIYTTTVISTIMDHHINYKDDDYARSWTNGVLMRTNAVQYRRNYNRIVVTNSLKGITVAG